MDSSAGVEIYPLIEGQVNEYELRQAAVFAHESWTSWKALSTADRAMIVAHYKLHQLIDLYYKTEEVKALTRARN